MDVVWLVCCREVRERASDVSWLKVMVGGAERGKILVRIGKL
jgi:hypothetical protein